MRERLAAPAHATPRGHVETFAIPLQAGAVHEWLGGESERGWCPPLSILIDLARRAATPSEARGGTGLIVWIGRACHPHARSLITRHGGQHDRALLQRSIYVETPDTASRLWAIDTALRSAAVSAVVADGRGLDMAATRRLQLASESSGCVALLARPLSELKSLSAAATRWVVRPDTPTGVTPRPRWSVELVRSKGLRPMGSTEGIWSRERVWRVEWNHAACALVASSDMEHGPCEAAPASTGGIRLTG